MLARIVLGCSEGLSNGEVAKRLRITGATVCKWRERFRVERLEGLLDEPRPGAPRSITHAQVEEVVTKTLEFMRAIVLCVDEKSKVQALNRSQPFCR